MHLPALDSELEVASPPYATQIGGTGHLSFAENGVPVTITVTLVPGRTTAFTCIIDRPERTLVQSLYNCPPGRRYSVRGSLEGRRFCCDRCVAEARSWKTADSGSQFHVVLSADRFARVVFDDETVLGRRVTRAQFALMTYLGPALDISVDGWHYHVVPSKHRDSVSAWVLAWGLPVESALLVAIPNRPAATEDVIAHTDDFLRILSLYEGDLMSYHRVEFVLPDDTGAEVWDPTRWVQPPSPGNRMRTGMQSQRFVHDAVHAYCAMSPVERALLSTAIGYHLAAKGARILHVAFVSEAVAWEMLISARLGTMGRALPPEARELARRVGAVANRWCRKYASWPECNGYKGLVLGSLRWRHLREGVTQLVDHLGLGTFLDAAGIDPLLLKRFRDSIVHTGDFPRGYPDFPRNYRLLREMLDVGDLVFRRILCPDLPVE